MGGELRGADHRTVARSQRLGQRLQQQLYRIVVGSQDVHTAIGHQLHPATAGKQLHGRKLGAGLHPAGQVAADVGNARQHHADLAGVALKPALAQVLCEGRFQRRGMPLQRLVQGFQLPQPKLQRPGCPGGKVFLLSGQQSAGGCFVQSFCFHEYLLIPACFVWLLSSLLYHKHPVKTKPPAFPAPYAAKKSFFSLFLL